MTKIAEWPVDQVILDSFVPLHEMPLYKITGNSTGIVKSVLEPLGAAGERERYQQLHTGCKAIGLRKIQ